MATLVNVAIAEFFWKMQKKLVFHFEGGGHAAFPQKPVVNECETDPYFLQLSQNMATNCLFTFVFFPVLT